MKYVNRKGVDLSVFSLGTVQLGRDYGFGEFRNKPQKEYAFQLLDRAVANGVNSLDTANNYGESQNVVGEWLQIEKENKPMVVTKIGPFDHSSPEALKADMQAQTEACLKTLGTDCIDILMAHYYEDWEKDPDIVSAFFADLKAKGVIRYSGVSVYSFNNYQEIAKAGFDAIQIPLNLFDWTQIENGGIQALADAGMMIFARSVFLQGVVFMTPETLDPRMDFCLPYLEKFHALCEEFKMSPAVLACSFVLSVPGITTVVLGCQTIEQVDSNCEMMDEVRYLSDAEMAKIREAFVNIDPRVINPNLWFNKAKTASVVTQKN